MINQMDIIVQDQHMDSESKVHILAQKIRELVDEVAHYKDVL